MKKVKEVKTTKILRGEDFIEHILGNGRQYGISVGFRELVFSFNLNSSDSIATISNILSVYEDYTLKVDADIERPASYVMDRFYEYAVANKCNSMERLESLLQSLSKWAIMELIEDGVAVDDDIQYGVRLDKIKF